MRRFKAAVLITAACLAAGLLAVPAMAAEKKEKDYSFGDPSWEISDEEVLGVWDASEDKQKYEIQLYRTKIDKKNKVGNKISVSKDSCDFTKRIVDKGSGTYYYTIKGKKAGETYTSEPLKITSSELSDIRENYRYRTKNKDGSDSEFKHAAKHEERIMVGPGVKNDTAPAPGWHCDTDGTWTFIEDDGTLFDTGWKESNGLWYYFRGGVMVKSDWVLDPNGDWYYMNPDGSMMTNDYTPSGVWIGEDGKYIGEGVPTEGTVTGEEKHD